MMVGAILIFQRKVCDIHCNRLVCQKLSIYMLFSKRNYLLLIQKRSRYQMTSDVFLEDQDLPALGPRRQDWLQKYVKLSSPEAIETWMSYLPGGVGRAGGWQTWFLVCVCFFGKKTFFGGDQVSHSNRISPNKPAKRI